MPDQTPSMPPMTDAEMIDWLEAQINTLGEIHLHDGQHPRGNGLGLRPGSVRRTLRQAIQEAARPPVSTLSLERKDADHG